MRRILFVALLWTAPFLAVSQMTSKLAFRRFTTLDGLPQIQAERVWQDSRGYIYIGTLSGFVRYDGRTFTPFLKGRRENIVGFAEVDGQVRALGFIRQWLVCGDEVTMLPIDPDGKWFVNNFNSGDLPNGYVLLEDKDRQQRHLCRLTAKGFTTVNRSKALDAMTPDRRLRVDMQLQLHIPSANILSYCQIGKRLLAFADDGIYEVRNKRAVRILCHTWDEAFYGLIVRQSDDHELIIADEHSLYRYDGQRVECIACGFNLIKDLLVDCWGRLWVATYQGVYCLFGRNFTNHKLTDENDIVRAIGVDGGGQVVMGTLNGKLLSGERLLLDEPSRYYASCATTIDGCVYIAAGGDVAAIENGNVRWLHLPDDDYHAVATDGRRLVAVSRRQILSYDPITAATDILSTDVPQPWCAAFDGQGQLWVGSTFGLYRVAGDSTSQYQYPSQRLIITAMEATPRGDIIFASSDSLFCISHGTVRHVDELQAATKGHEIRALHVSPRQLLIVATIDGLLVSRLTDAGQFRLSNSHWFDHENGFTMIEPQKATMAETADGTVWLPGVEEVASFCPEQLMAYNTADTFISPPRQWYERWWVWIIALLLLSALLWLSARWYEKRRHARMLERLKRERRMMDLQIQAIRLRGIPHFHANVLTAIEYFVMNSSEREANHYLELYSDFTNDTLQDIDKPARTVDEEVAYVRKYLELEQLRYGERLRFVITVADNVNRQALLPTMLLHTYCENAIKHGISPKEEGGTVSVIITSHRGDTVVTVEDDGIGRASAKRKGTSSNRQGLRILREQIQLMNKQNKHRIREHVQTLRDNHHRVCGTRFEMIIPIDFNFK